MHRPTFSLRRSFPTLLLLTVVLALVAVAPPRSNAATLTAPQPAAEGGRLVVIGFDGGDYRTASGYAAEGQMPNLKALGESGTFAPLGTTYSAESPVAWAALNTGQNPSKTGVPGFVKRALKDGDEEVDKMGAPMPMVGHQRTEERSIQELEAGPIIGFLGAFDETMLMVIVGLGVTLLFLLAFKVVLRLKFGLAVFLSLVLGGVGAYGAKTAKTYVPDSIPGIIANPVEVPSFWDVAAKSGAKAVVIDAAMAWDQPHVEGTEVLGGLGLPDCRGDNGQWFVYTTDKEELEPGPVGRSSPTAGTVFRLPDWEGDTITSAIYGPKNFYRVGQIDKEIAEIDELLKPSSGTGWKEGSRLRELKKELKAQLEEGARVEVPMTIVKRDGGAKITVGPETQDLDSGVWSDWYSITFELNPLIKAKAVTRMKILEDSDEMFTLFVNTLDIDPRDAQFWQPVSQPPSFSADLANRIGGPFETFGWASATMPFKDKVISAETMLEDLEFTMKWREDLTRSALEKGDYDVLMSVFSTPDRVQHMCYQFYDPEHPLYDEEAASRKMIFFGEEIELREAIPAIYRQVDRIIGWVQEAMAPEDTLIVCADHGFQSFRHQVNLNNWLAQEGYLKVSDNLMSPAQGAMLGFVDWTETRAYAMGLGMIYLNLKGREIDGIVDPKDARALLEEIAGKLQAMADDRDGKSVPVVEQVVLIDDVHDGPYRDREGDLMVGFKPYYRVSWGTTSGGLKMVKKDGSWGAGPIFQPNTSPWSGGHVSVAPEHVAGIFASNRKVDIPEEGVHLLHIAPTALQLLGAPMVKEFDKPALKVH